MIDNKMVITAILREYEKHGTWADAAEQIGFNPGYLYLVAHGERPASNRLRAALGLPTHVIAVEPCPCGKVHVRATCRQGRKLARRARSSEPDFLRFVQDVAVPFLEAKKACPKS